MEKQRGEHYRNLPPLGRGAVGPDGVNAISLKEASTELEIYGGDVGQSYRIGCRESDELAKNLEIADRIETKDCVKLA